MLFRSALFVPNPDHKTSPHLVLTDAGRATFERLMGNGRAYYRELAEELSAADIAALRRDLRMFCDALDRREAKLADDED